MGLNKKTTIGLSVMAAILVVGIFFAFGNGSDNLDLSELDIGQSSVTAQVIDNQNPNNQNLRQATFKAESMFCAGCAAGTKYLVEQSPGVVQVKASLQDKTYTVTYDPEITNTQKIIESSERPESIIVEDKEI